MESRENDRLYMQRCLQLAACGRGRVSPNPMVGAVIVCDGRIIGEGYHRQFGGPHAEVNAVNSVKESGLLSRSTLYVSLEPCSHYGKTPPCCRLIIEKKIPRVVVGCLDPFPSVSGRGISMLREAGVEVVTGVLERECRALNAVFMTAHERQRPYVMLKWAQSRNGFIDRRRTAGEPACRFSDSQTSLFLIAFGLSTMPYWWVRGRYGSMIRRLRCVYGRGDVPRCGLSSVKTFLSLLRQGYSPMMCRPKFLLHNRPKIINPYGIRWQIFPDP